MLYDRLVCFLAPDLTPSNYSRDRISSIEEWRLLFGLCGIVEECLELLQMEDIHTSRHIGTEYVQAVRLLANCCGDPLDDGSADGNRAQVVAKLPIDNVLLMMQAPNQRVEAFALIYNVGVYIGDYNNL